MDARVIAHMQLQLAEAEVRLRQAEGVENRTPNLASNFTVRARNERTTRDLRQVRDAWRAALNEVIALRLAKEAERS